MIYITKKKFDRIVSKMKTDIYNNTPISNSVMCEMIDYKLWDVWSKIVCYNFRYNKTISISESRIKSLPEFIEQVRNKLI